MIEKGSSMRILLVDDVQLDRMQLAIRLKQLGHVVEAVGSGKEALNVYSDFDPELVLLDISMPDMDGFEVANEVRGQFPEWVPIIFLSGHEEPEMIAKAIDAGGDDYLIKPVNKVVLNSKLIAMQRIAHMRRELKQSTAKLEELNILLQQQANEDGLTKLYNRRYMDTKLEESIAWHGRRNIPMTVILLDVDFFKPYNDNYGHIQGDKCLQGLAGTLKQLFVRAGEFVGRYGGEEFVLILSDTDSDAAMLQATRIKEALHEMNYAHEHSTVSDRVTASQGVLSFVPDGGESTASIYEKVDQALYQAKQSGRNTFIQRNILELAR
ncbi:diguanylate cyclase [Vibrio splendidus]|jgi:diguanylate cyclase (GGDEF)-like protein|uniref:diguanylate cyclase n=2 Tax=Vibrio splendidus TaxID=29497 RepID=A0AB35N0E6_VIBSP|nr:MULTISPECIES: diguanylate cyclase [Vibrio]MBE8568129.1 diguanylate cyclase [Vibrio sp. OPT20]MBB1462479.1 diguanylate cyclase [Vibrio sp. SG41-7]MCC4790891.1 diguanylate cyclase [Vibrio splendidus]MCC4862723.1 diguanylate cyclase [Vibrio splendidus]MDH5895792.1 diguanylate cyclase [Vibrio splendidus]